MTLIGAIMTAGCGDDSPPFEPQPPPPAQVASIAVTSPVDTVMAIGWAAQLAAEARDAGGNPMPGVGVSWHSTDPEVASVGPTGLLSGLSAGVTTVEATTQGMVGSLAMRVVIADLPAIAMLLEDPYTERLVAAVSDAPRAALEAALGDCAGALAAGHLLDAQTCMEALGGVSAEDTADVVPLAVLGLVAFRADQLLGLSPVPTDEPRVLARTGGAPEP